MGNSAVCFLKVYRARVSECFGFVVVFVNPIDMLTLVCFSFFF